jgi:exodeoxyribonuclease VII large subunit
VADVRALTPSEAAERIIPSADELTGRLKQFDRRLGTMLRSRAEAARARLKQLAASRVLRQPKSLVHNLVRRLDELEQQSMRAIRRRLAAARDQVQATAARLESLSPLAVLSRGYSVTTRAADGQIVTDSQQVQPGEAIRTRLASGQIVSRVE